MDPNESHKFMPINSSLPGFSAAVTATGTCFKLESSDRKWGSPTNRYVRITAFSANDIFVSFGTTIDTDVPSTLASMLLLMPDTYVIPVRPSTPGMGLKTFGASSTYYVVLGMIG